ncbi:TPA: serine protease [Bacillus thuringiensis]|nr:serine protease [Bacillus thuringiensis]
MKKRTLFSVATATMLTLGVSTLNAQAATQEQTKPQNIQQYKSQIPCTNHIDIPKKMQDCLQSMMNDPMKVNSILSQQKDCVDSNQQKDCADSNQQKECSDSNQQKDCADSNQQENCVDSNQQKVDAPEPVQNNTPQQSTEKETSKGTKENLSQFEQRVVELTNIERTKQGLPALQVDMNLSKVARLKSADMQKNHYFDHTSPTYGSPFDMMRKFDISYSSAGENIAQGQRTPEEVVQAWMDSPGHRANILNHSYTHIGVGYVESGNYWTQEFISK